LFAHLIRGSVTIATANGFSKLLALVFIVVAGRLLGPQEYGRLALILSLGVIASTVPATAFPQALLWRIGSVDDRQSRGAVLMAATIGTIALAILVVLMLALLNIPWLVSVIVLADCATYLFRNLQQGILNYRQVALFSTGRNLAKLLLLLSLWFGIPGYEWNHSHIVIIYLLAPLLVIAILEILFPSGIPLQTIDDSLFKELSAYGMPIAGSAVALSVVMQGDIVLLEYFHGEMVTGKYYAVRQLFLPVMLLPVAARGLLVPAISGNHLSQDGWRKLTAIILGVAAFVAIITGLGGPLLIETVYGPGFKVNQSLTLTVCAAAWVLSARGIIEAVLLGRGYSTRALMANATAGVIALATYLWIIPTNGTDGASEALLLASIVALVTMIVAFATLGREIGASPLASGNGN
jgi:O-antigen/teichoic acid export membrane protein